MSKCSTCANCQNLKKEIERLQALLVQTERTHPLTGLPNKKALEEKLDDAIKQSSRGHESYLFFIDIDNFKDINDHYTHTFGDDVLQVIAKTFTHCLRTTDTIFHISGDEFVVLAETKNPAVIKYKIQQAIAGTDVMYNHHCVLTLGASAGFYQVSHSEDAKTILDGADKSLQADKDAREAQGLRHKRT